VKLKTDEHPETSAAFANQRLCQAMNVSPLGLRAVGSRPASRKKRMDVVIAHQLKE